jgi:GDP-L-fucose synthase
MKNIYIAGSTGFLGRSLVNEFNNDGKYKVVKNTKRIDLTNIKSINQFFKNNKIEYVINAAGHVGGIKKNIENQILFLDKNYLIQSNLIKIAHIHRVKKFINISSSCIYPKNYNKPLKENYILTGKFEQTNEGYALAKVCGLKLAEYYKNKYNFNIKTCIPCNLYGIDDKFFDESSHFIPGIISKIYEGKVKNKKNIKLWGSGNPKREIMLNTDVAKIIKFCLENNNIEEQNINIGSGVDFTIKQYASKIKKKIGYKGKIVWDKSKPDGIKRKLLDISLLKKYNFKINNNLDEGLNKVIDHFLLRSNFK